MSIPPSVTDWAWLGKQPLDDIARRATQESEPASWLKHAYAWIYARLDDSRRRNLPRPIAEPRGPSAGMVPVLGATSTGTGCLGFVAVRFESTSCTKPTDDMECAVQEAAEAVADVFRRLDFNLGYPHWRLDAWQGGGRSVGLSSVVASVISLLSLSVREDFAATGCYASGEGLSPVPPDSLSAKLQAAKRWGYQRILLVATTQRAQASLFWPGNAFSVADHQRTRDRWNRRYAGSVSNQPCVRVALRKSDLYPENQSKRPDLACSIYRVIA